MSTYSEYKGLELPTSPEHYDIAIVNKNNMVIDSELHKLDLKNESQDNLLAAKEELHSEVSRATEKENSILEKLDDEIIRAETSESEIIDLLENEINRATLADETNSNNLAAHIEDENNPHKVTKEQVGLGNVENKSSATIRSEITKTNVTNALGYTPYTPTEVDNKLAALETNIDWKESVGTFNDIAAAYPEPKDGWTVNVNDTDYTYRYNGDKWIPISANAIPKATDKLDGLISAEDKKKLDEVAAGAEVNVQADWNITDSTSDAFIKNKPASLPANGGTAKTISDTLPISKGGTGKTTAKEAANELIESLVVGQEGLVPSDTAIYLTHNGTEWVRRKIGTLVSYIKSKLATVFVNKSGDTMTGNLTITKPNSDANIFCGVGSGGVNHGIYSNTLGKWIAYADNIKVYLLGNADTATKLATTRTINGTSFDGSANITTANWGTSRTIGIGGDVVGSASINGSANATINVTRRGCVCGQSSNTTTNPYYKIASISTTNNQVDPSISFKVSANFGDSSTKLGILQAHFRTTASGYWESGQLVWEYAVSGIDTSKFILVHNTSTNPCVVELWAIIDVAYQQLHFDVLTEGNRTSRTYGLWTLYNTVSAGSQSAVTSGYTTQNSTLASLKNNAATATTATKLGTATVGSGTKPIYLNAGTATASTSTVGSSTRPVYMNAGTVTQCGTSLGVDITGNAATATKATQDGNGNVITDTYAKNSTYGYLNLLIKGPNNVDSIDTGSIVNGNTWNISVGNNNIQHEVTYSIIAGYNNNMYYAGKPTSGSILIGLNNKCNGGNIAMFGHYANSNVGSSSGADSTDALVIGNGASNARSNAIRADYNGKLWCKAAYSATGADYAELFEWTDGNPNKEDRRGYFVTMNGDKIKKASTGDWILGVVSANPCVLGNTDMEWNGQFLKDEFGAFLTEEFTEKQKRTRIDQITNDDGDTEDVEVEYEEEVTGTRYVLNPDYDPEQKYVDRISRPEWDAIGMMGVLSVYDDGSCQVNGFCSCNDSGIATASETGYRVIQRLNNNIIKIVFK